LRKKTLIIVSVILAGLVVVLYATSQTVLIDGLTALEEHGALFAGGLIVSILILMILEIMVLARLTHRSVDVPNKDTSGDPPAPVSATEKTKITNLVGKINAINDTLKSLEQSQCALRESEDRYRRLVELSFDGIGIHSDGKILLMNPAGANLLGAHNPEELIGKPLLDFIHPDYQNFVQERIQHIGETGVAPLSEEQFVRLDGGVIDAEAMAIPITYQNKSAVQLVFRDITERKEAEKERESLLKELETKNKELERFTYTVSHDLQSSLITIQGFTGRIKDYLKGNELEKAESSFYQIEKAVASMADFLKDTLELSRIGHVANPRGDVPFSEIVQEALEQTAEQIRASSMEVAIAENFPTVQVDRTRIVEVLVNLISNSIKYMDGQSHPKITIGHRREGAETVLFVQDNGRGVDTSQHEKVFDLFYQVDKNSQGTGAGLAIVKRIIEVHDGRIWLESEKGNGCTVYFTLPVSS
jgi:PAS domain S-box-containing protein